MHGSKDLWSHHRGEFSIPYPNHCLTNYKGSMCPECLALYHPAAGKLINFTTKGYPTMTGKPWNLIQMEEEIDRGTHVSALQPVATKILA